MASIWVLQGQGIQKNQFLSIPNEKSITKNVIYPSFLSTYINNNNRKTNNQ